MRKTEQDFLKCLAAAATDHGIRLSYAAFLEKRSYRARAELLKLSVEVAELERKSRDFDGPGLTAAERDRHYEIENRLEQLSSRIDSSWITKIDPTLAIPSDLTELGKNAALATCDFLGKHGWKYEGGGEAFESPASLAGKLVGGINHAVLVISPVTEMLEHCLGIPPTDGRLEEEFDRCLNSVGVWQCRYDESRTLIHPNKYPGFAIGLG